MPRRPHRIDFAKGRRRVNPDWVEPLAVALAVLLLLLMFLWR